MALRSGTARSGQHGGILAEKGTWCRILAPTTHRLNCAQADADAAADADADARSDARSDARADASASA